MSNAIQVPGVAAATNVSAPDNFEAELNDLLGVNPSANRKPETPKPQFILDMVVPSATLTIPGLSKRFFVSNGKLEIYTKAELLAIVRHHRALIDPNWRLEAK